ncbi:phosphopyruvate hydratase [Patescibacteria group bacterium]|nr:phosphopyruvate hydratase [Patescibacteria group bacterium]
MNTIKKCKAYKIKDSRGDETLEVEMSSNGHTVWASVPAGKSTGSREAVALPVDEAVWNVNRVISPELIGKKADVFEVDDLLVSLDGTENKSNLGANAILGVSLATLKLEAKIANQPLWKHIQSLGHPVSKSVGFPRLFVNVLNGGAHAKFRLPFQEYMFVLGNGMNVAGPINQLQTLFEQLKKKLEAEGKEIKMGDEGGFSFESDDIEEPFNILSELHDKLAIDVAGGEFFENGEYNVCGQKYSLEKLSNLYELLVKKYPLISIEDPFADNDFEAFAFVTKKMRDYGVISQKEDVLVVGDDLTTTNPQMIAKAVDGKLINAVLIKPNQIGTISETLKAIKMTHEAGLKTIISHRSGETMDSFIADLAMGVGAFGLKAGTMFQSERKEKYDRLLEIEQEVNSEK